VSEFCSNQSLERGCTVCREFFCVDAEAAENRQLRALSAGRVVKIWRFLLREMCLLQPFQV
jgi:hypothetical protein